MAVMARLMATLGWDATAADQGMARFQRRAADHGRSIGRDFGNAFKGMAVGALGIGGAAAIFGSIKNSLEDATRILREAGNSGIDAETFQALERSSKRIGVEWDDISGAIETLVEKAHDAVTGEVEESRTLFEKAFGLGPSDIAKFKTVEELILGISRAIEKSDNNIETQRAGVILLSEDYKKLNALFRAGFADLVEQNRQLATSEETLVKLSKTNQEFNDTLEELNATWKDLVVVMAPALKLSAQIVNKSLQARNEAGPKAARALFLEEFKIPAIGGLSVNRIKGLLQRLGFFKAVQEVDDAMSGLKAFPVAPGKIDLEERINNALTPPPSNTPTTTGTASPGNPFSRSVNFDSYAQSGRFLTPAAQKNDVERFRTDLFRRMDKLQQGLKDVSDTISEEVGDI